MKILIFINLLALFLLACKERDVININLDIKHERVSLFAPGFISTDLYERDTAISKDGNEIIYTVGDYKQNKRMLVRFNNVNDTWSGPEKLSFSGRYQDIEPFISPDGNKLYFASNRPIGQDSQRLDYNIWFASNYKGHWVNPEPLDSIINSVQDEFYPSLSRQGNLYFTSTRNNGIGLEDIFFSKYENGSFGVPMVLDSNINSKKYEFNAYVNPEEDLLIFSSFGRHDGLGGGDLYMSRKDSNGQWKPAVNLGAEINSDQLDYCPFVDWKNEVFYFTSNRIATENIEIEDVITLKAYSRIPENGFGNIYRCDINFLK